jgi:WD40 repeat protein
MTAMNDSSDEPRPSREREIFLEALNRAAGPERRAYLDVACGQDRALRQRLDGLLAAHERTSPFLEQPAVAGARAVSPATAVVVLPSGAPAANSAMASTTNVEKPGDRIGRYKLLQEIGQGGCGVVFMADQEEPVRRRVAFKVIKLGMDTREVISRFEAERQALAMMDHPNIAKVFDGGATDTGRPYFVMELVRGVPITDYCDQNHLPTAERLQLFMQVCHALQHAHQKGIIHRDIKPSNILVSLHDDVAVPKVIDFGIAKAIGERLTDKTVFTRFEHFIGTPAYMSPEQAGLSSLDIDTRSDIYALGVLLYELLTGRPPFDPRDLAQAGLEEMLRLIREAEPPKPSTRLRTLQGQELTTTAQRRQTEPPRLISLVRGDLDWIVMKCLEKNRTRRYETANALAQDIERHLEHQPVTAAAPTVRYQLAKFARRNRAALTTAGAFLLLLLAGAGVSVWQAVRATRNAAEADRQATRASKLAREQAAQRRRAESLAELNREHLYAARINLAEQIFEQGNVARVVALLDSLRPASGQGDLRGFEWYHLWQLCHSERRHLAGHAAPVRAVAYSADGSLLATAGNEHAIRIWDALTGRERHVLKGHQGWISSVAFAADGTLASGSADRTVKLWDPVSGKALHAFTNFRHEVTAIAFAPHSALLAGASGQIATGTGTPVTRYLVSGQGGEVRVWNAQTHEQVGAFQAQKEGVLSLAFSSDGETLATGSGDGTVKVWKARTGQELKTLTLGEPVFSLAYAPDGQTLATAFWRPERTEAQVEVREAKSWGVTCRIARVPPVTCMAFAPDGRTLASGGIDQAVRVWDVAIGLERSSFKGHTGGVWALAYAPDGQTLASGSWDRTVKLWDLTRSPGRALLTPACGYSVALSPDGGLVACGGHDFVELWDLAREQRVYQVPLGERVGDISVVFSPDGGTLAAAGTDRTLSLLDAKTGQRRQALRGHKDKIWSLAFAPKGRLVATGSGDSTVKLWDVVDGTERATLVGHSSTIRSLAFTPDGRGLVSGSFRELKFWDLATTNLLETIEDVSPLVALSPDGRLLASGAESAFGGIRIRDFSTRRELGRIVGHRDTIYHLAFSADGKTLATASWDGTAKLWRVPGGELLLTVPSHSGVMWATAFSRDGGTFAAGSGSGAIGGRVLVLRAATERQASEPDPIVPAVASPKTGVFPEPRAALADSIEPRPAQATPGFVDLSPYYNGSLTKGWIPSSSYGSTAERNLGELPRGLQEFAGTRFDVRGLIQLGGRSLNGTLQASYPLEVHGIRVQQRCRRLHFLHGTGWRAGEGQTIGSYRIHLAGGGQQEAPIVYGANVRDWWHDPALEESTPEAVEAWTGKNDAIRTARTVLKLYKFTWNNPTQDCVVETIDFVSLNTQSSPFLLAITVEP